MAVNDKEQQQINRLVAQFEARSGMQAVAAVVGRADAYPEIAWKAYAMGSAAGALAAASFPFVLARWNEPYALAFEVMAILGVGALLACLALLLPAVGRLFVDRLRAQGELHQYAVSMFLERELYRTADRCAVLVVIGAFERVGVVIRDTGLSGCLPANEIERIADGMRGALRQGNLTGAFEAAFAQIEAVALRHGHVPRPANRNEIADGVVTEKGA